MTSKPTATPNVPATKQAAVTRQAVERTRIVQQTRWAPQQRAAEARAQTGAGTKDPIICFGLSVAEPLGISRRQMADLLREPPYDKYYEIRGDMYCLMSYPPPEGQLPGYFQQPAYCSVINGRLIPC